MAVTVNPPRWLQSPVGACMLYGGISIALTFFNKGIFSFYHFKHPVRAAPRAQLGAGLLAAAGRAPRSATRCTASLRQRV